MHPRRFLPSIKLLQAFEAVVRLGSVTAAANDLDLTQSTVSRLILSLEEQLGGELFVRQRRKLIPTAAAHAYQKDVARSLDIIVRATMGVMTNSDSGTLSLAVLPTFATRWLNPRLGQFLQSHPGLSVNLSTRLNRVDFESEAFDAAICFGEKPWPGTCAMRLLDEKVTACVSPSFAKAYDLSSEAGLDGLPLLYLENRPTVWEDWFAGQKIEAGKNPGMMMDQFSMVIQAAISGMGIALLPEYLANIEIAERRLVPVLREAIPVRGSYWLVWPESKSEYEPLCAFQNCLSEFRANPNKITERDGSSD